MLSKHYLIIKLILTITFFLNLFTDLFTNHILLQIKKAYEFDFIDLLVIEPYYFKTFIQMH
jgi:hypothetical protein